MPWPAVVSSLLLLSQSALPAPLAPAPVSVSGIILDPDGRPVANATVEVMWWSSTEGTVGYRGEHGGDQSVRTGPRGEFSVPRLTPGRLHLSFLIPGMLDVYPEDRSLRPGHSVTDLLVKSPGYGGAISGVVRSEWGNLIPRAFVSTRWEFGDPFGEPERYPAADDRAWTGPDGRFRLPHIQPGKQRVTAYARGWPPAEAEVEVGEGGEARSEIVLQRCRPGTWTLLARVVGANGHGVAGARADVAWDEDRHGSGSRVSRSPAFVSSPLGGMLAYDLPADKPVWLRVFHPDYGSWEQQLVGTEGEYRKAVVRLSPVTVLCGIVHLVNADTAVPPLIEVWLRQGFPGPGRLYDLWARLTPDAHGRYRIAGLSPGKWELTADVDGGRRKLTETIEVAPGQSTIEHDLVFPAGASLSGQVTDADRRPLFGSHVLLWRKDRSYGPLEVDYGRYRLRDIDPGAYDAVAWAPGFWPASLGVALPEGADWSDADVRLGDGPVVSGMVVDDAGRPLPAVPVFLDRVAAWMSLPETRASWQHSPASPAETTPLQAALSHLDAPLALADAAGRFTIRGVRAPLIALFAGAAPPGYEAMAMGGRPSIGAGWQPLSLQPRLPDGRYAGAGGVVVGLGGGQSVSDVVIRVSKAVADQDLCRVRGRVSDPHAQFGQLSGLRVVISSVELGEQMGEAGNLFQSWDSYAPLGVDGAFEVPNVPPGPHVVLVGGNGRAAELGALELRPGASVDLGELPVPVAGAVEGGVLNAEGRPITKGTVLAGRCGAYLSGSDVWFSYFKGQRQPIGPDGSYRFEQLGGGIWYLMTVCPSEPASAIRRVFINGGSQRLDFRHSYTGRIAGRVSDTAGRPVAGVAVSCQGRALRESLEIKTRADGSYEVVGLPPGRYGLSAGGWPYFSTPARSAEVPDTAAPVRQDFVLEPGGWIEVRVVTAEGKPVTTKGAACALQVGLPWGERWAAWAREDGTVGTPLLKAGTYVVRVRPSEAREQAWWETEPLTVTPGRATRAVIELPPGQ